MSRQLSSHEISPADEAALSEKLDAMAVLLDGWNGYQAPAPNSDAIDAARGLVELMVAAKEPPTRLAPSAVGGVGITRRRGPRKCFVEFLNNGLISVLFSDDVSKSLETFQTSNSANDFRILLSRMQGYLDG